MQNPAEVQLAAKSLLEQLPLSFREEASRTCGIILGTGLGDAAEEILASPDSRLVSWEELEGFPESGVPSHKGAFIYGTLCGLPVLAQQGRVHLYEGYSPEQICLGTRVMASLGLDRLIITNAAGALNPLFQEGSLMCISDMINFTGISPLSGANTAAWGDRFPDMSCPFSPWLQELALAAALEHGTRMERGVYIGVHGPEMETAAETRMYRGFGADAIGMSTVLEVIAARHMGMSVLGISCLTNKNLPDCMRETSFEDVVNTAKQAGKLLAPILARICAKLAAHVS